MSTIGTLINLADWAKQLVNDEVQPIVELLSQKNGAARVVPFMQGNLSTGHRTVVRTSLPTVGWRQVNQGVTGTKGTTAQETFTCGRMETNVEVDVMMAELNRGSSRFRMNEISGQLEAFRQEFSQTFFYGNEGTAPEEFTGLAQYYNSLSGNTADTIINAAGAGSDNSSIYLVFFGEDGIHGIVPKGSSAGISHQYKGEQYIQGSLSGNTSRYWAHVDNLVWQCGLAVIDHRQAGRVCNIDISNLVAESSDADLIKRMTQLYHAIGDTGKGKGYWFMNRTVFQYLDLQAYAGVKAGGGLTYQNVDGQIVPTFRGIPIVVDDQLTEAEATVS